MHGAVEAVRDRGALNSGWRPRPGAPLLRVSYKDVLCARRLHLPRDAAVPTQGASTWGSGAGSAADEMQESSYSCPRYSPVPSRVNGGQVGAKP